MIIKGASFHPEMMNKTILKIIGNVLEKSPIMQISEDLLLFQFATS